MTKQDASKVSCRQKHLAEISAIGHRLKCSRNWRLTNVSGSRVKVAPGSRVAGRG